MWLGEERLYVRQPLVLIPFILVLVLFVAAPRALAQEPDTVSVARTLAVGGKRGDAIALLRRHLETAVDDSDARILLSTVLSWEGQYDEARTLLEMTLVTSPTSSDALHALLNVELWSDRPRQAKHVAEQGLRESPNDEQFLQGWRRAIQQIDLERPWEVSTSMSSDWFSDHRVAWREAGLSVRRATPVGSLSVRGAHAQRFGLDDNQFEVEAYPRFRQGTYGYVAGAFAPDPTLYPKWRYAADLYQSLGAGFEASGGIRRLNFGTITTIYVGSLSKYVGAWLLTGRTYYVPDRVGNSSRSYHASMRRYFGSAGTSFVGARYARGFAREEVRDLNDFEVLGSDTFSGEMKLNLTSRWRFGMSGGSSRQDRPGRIGLRQNSLAAELGVGL